jgi:hypothetical protein
MFSKAFQEYFVLQATLTSHIFSSSLVKHNPLMNLPYLVDGDVSSCMYFIPFCCGLLAHANLQSCRNLQKVITQSQPVFRYIADKCNFSGETADEKLKCDQTLAQVVLQNTNKQMLVARLRGQRFVTGIAAHRSSTCVTISSASATAQRKCLTRYGLDVAPILLALSPSPFCVCVFVCFCLYCW